MYPRGDTVEAAETSFTSPSPPIAFEQHESVIAVVEIQSTPNTEQLTLDTASIVLNTATGGSPPTLAEPLGEQASPAPPTPTPTGGWLAYIMAGVQKMTIEQAISYINLMFEVSGSESPPMARLLGLLVLRLWS